MIEARLRNGDTKDITNWSLQRIQGYEFSSVKFIYPLNFDLGYLNMVISRVRCEENK